MTKTELLEKIKKDSYSKEQLIGWVTCLPGTTMSRKPTILKVGDVFLHKIFLHPFVLLEKKQDKWLCGLMTTEETCTEILSKCESRFFYDSYFTCTLFTETEPAKNTFINPYDNTAHLKKVLKQLKILLL